MRTYQSYPLYSMATLTTTNGFKLLSQSGTGAWNPKCSDAGAIRLFGIRCIISPTSSIHTSTHYQTTGTQTHLRKWDPMGDAVRSSEKSLAASSRHSGDWLLVAPISSVGLKLSDKVIIVPVAQRQGYRACAPHTWICGKTVYSRSLHGLACRESASRHNRHSQMNDIIWRTVKRT